MSWQNNNVYYGKGALADGIGEWIDVSIEDAELSLVLSKTEEWLAQIPGIHEQTLQWAGTPASPPYETTRYEARVRAHGIYSQLRAAERQMLIQIEPWRARMPTNYQTAVDPAAQALQAHLYRLANVATEVSDQIGVDDMNMCAKDLVITLDILDSACTIVDNMLSRLEAFADRLIYSAVPTKDAVLAITFELSGILGDACDDLVTFSTPKHH